jgi:hypothetical protein
MNTSIYIPYFFLRRYLITEEHLPDYIFSDAINLYVWAHNDIWNCLHLNVKCQSTLSNLYQN